MRRALPASDEGEGLYADASAVLTCRQLESLPGFHATVVCQLRYAANMDFLAPAPLAHHYAPPLTPPSTPLRPVVAPPTISAQHSHYHASRPLSVGDELGAPHLASGSVLSPSLLPCVFCRLLEMPQLPELLELFLVGDVYGSCLLLLKLPAALLGRDYAAAFTYLTRNCSAVPLGLLRDGGTRAGDGPRQVVCSPPPGLNLRADDRIFALGSGSLESRPREVATG